MYLEALARYEIEHVPRCHDIFFRNCFPYGYDREYTWAFLHFVVKQNAATILSKFPKDIFLETFFHGLHHRSGDPRSSTV